MSKSKAKVEDRVAELTEAGEALKIIRATLTIEGYSNKEIATATKGLATAKGGDGFAGRFYSWLAEEQRDMSDVELYILNPDNSENVRSHLSHYKGIAVLANTIWSNK